MNDAADRIASRFTSRFLRYYTRGKLRTDPLYPAVAERLRGSTQPLLDLGCGIGLLAFYLRETGCRLPITGIDYDERKIKAARRIAADYEGLTFVVGDARGEQDHRGSVVMLDMLQYFTDEDQRAILAAVAKAVVPGGVVVIRNGIADGTWRYRVTRLAESFARGIAWLRADRLNFPTMERLTAAFPGFEREIVPLWGGTPFNNYLFVFRRPASGTTNE